MVISDCGSLERVGAVGVRHAELFAKLPRLVIDHHASNEGAGDGRLGRSGGRRDLRDGHPARGAARRAARRRGGALAAALMAGIVMDTATFAHPNATPRTLAVSAALVEAGAPLSDISRRLYRTKPDAQLRLFGRVLDRLETADDGRVVWSTLTDADLAATGTRAAAFRGHHRPALAGGGGRGGRSSSRRSRDGTRISVRTQPGGVDATVLTGRFGGGGHARAAGATIELPLAEARPAVLAEARAARRRGPAAEDGHDVARPDWTAILVVAKPAGPTSHDVVALVRRLAATKRVGHGGTLDPFASGVLPVFLGHGTRLVEYHLGDRKGYRATICFGAASTTDDLEGELTASPGRRRIGRAWGPRSRPRSGRSCSVHRPTAR